MTQAVTEPSQEQQGKAERGNKTAENVRYGQAISEQGIGGKTPEEGGEANRGKSAPMRFGEILSNLLMTGNVPCRRIWAC